MSNRVHSIEYNDLENNLCQLQWNSLYVSIGGKWNQDRVNSSKIPTSNACLQMVPRFISTILEDCSNKTMVIVFDDFSQKTNKNHNIDIIQTIIQNKPHLHVYLVNKLLSSQVFNEFWEFTQPLLYKRGVPQSRFSIVNYVKYMNVPNLQEKQNTNISSFIYNEVKDDPKYCDCLYEWLGYSPYLYNYICNYKIIHTKHLYYGLDGLNRILDNYHKCGYISEYIQINNLNVIGVLNHLKPLDTDLPTPASLHVEIDSSMNRDIVV
uniref:Uncharacterized protein n=1 Tax=viral metagenome TaxID=1070528 RepID=A0A6C0AV61_9ZZZZ|tara:strand:+ start:15190 stop:15984 length:795 start_codon:yes stop_codon:yes gene_type:complete